MVLDPFALPDLPDLPTIGGKPKRQGPGELSPEDQQSLLGSLGNASLSGIRWLGETLSKPLAAVEGTISGLSDMAEGKTPDWGGGLLNLVPFSDAMGLTDPAQRATGGKLLHKWGITDTPDSWWGLGLDLPLDPITWLAPGLSKAGSLAEKAGLMKNLPWTAQKILGSAAEDFGPRMARRSLTLGQLGEYGGDAAKEAIANAAKGSGMLKAGQGYADLGTDILGSKLGDVAGLRAFPIFGPTIGTFGGETLAKGLDWVGNTLRYSAPGRYMANKFYAPAGGEGTLTGKLPQQLGAQAHQAEEVGAAGARAEFGKLQMAREALGLGTDADKDYVRTLIEGGEYPDKAVSDVEDMIQDQIRQHQATVLRNPGTPEADAAQDEIRRLTSAVANPEFRGRAWDFSRDTRAMLDAEQARAVAEGRNVRYEQDYAPRFMTVFPGEENIPGGSVEQQAAGQPMNAFDRSRLARNQFYGGIEGGTPQLRKIISDPDVAALVKGPGKRADKLQQIASLLDEKYVQPGIMRSTFTDDLGIYSPVKGAQVPQAPLLAQNILDMTDKQRAVGMFGNDPMLDLVQHLVGTSHASAHANAITDGLAFGNVLDRTGAAVGKTLPQFLRDTGLFAGDEAEGGLQAVLNKIDPSLKAIQQSDPKLYGQVLDTMRKWTVSPDFAKQMTAYADVFSKPQSLEGTANFLTSATALWKAWVTQMRPSFNTRYFFGHQLQSMLNGAWSWDSQKAAADLLRGKSPEYVLEIPAVRAALDAQGLAHTAENATEVLKTQFVRPTQLLDPFRNPGVGDMATISRSGLPADISTFNAAQPLSRPMQAGNILEALKGTGGTMGTDWGDVLTGFPGVGGRTTTTSPLGKVAEGYGNMVDSTARLGPFMKLMHDGVDAAQAQRLISDFQGEYTGRYFTPVERLLSKWIFPFYKFTKTQVLHMGQELAENYGGGRTAALLKGLTEAPLVPGQGQQPLVPDYLARSPMIPMGSDQEGSPRYLTNFGTMMEDPASFLGGGARGVLQELGSRLHPMLKTPIEWALRHSFWQSGDQGGRALSEQDPLLGGTIANITGSQNRNLLPGMVEQLAANSPASAYLTLARTLSDPRKELWARGVNALTGLKITDLPPKAVDRMIQEGLDQREASLGGREFSEWTIPPDVLARMSPAEQQAAAQISALRSLVSKRLRARQLGQPVPSLGSLGTL